MSTVIRNNKAYDSADADVVIAGIPTDIVEISYTTEQEHQLNHTLKEKATSWSKGKITDSCTITLMVQDISPIEKSLGGDLLKAKPFFINVSLVNEYNDIINDTILAKFQNQGREVTGDMGLNKQYDLFVLDIEYNNA
jgi:hypothetical protein